ncbi:uncharacterized protein LOC129596307 [Paramacrobiotus metropolitanus]|uniref:uncharacterized protein LOC129596307 n=1 Tax=Paramacrobiotus metropolitanus TaxID=2943436 RepID=UPI002445AA5B|nr:uncharacterized protein LOC129596307 [Paramacrobiotus metropolitanus]
MQELPIVNFSRVSRSSAASVGAMGKYRKTIGDFLNRDHKWAYQEIIAESIVVLWFALQIALKFGTRFFPEWQNTRLDPDYKTGLDSILAELGYPVDGCIWDEIVSSWIPTTADTVADSESTPDPAADDHRGRLGYVAVFITVCAAVLLSVSVGCSLLVNRNWRYSPWKKHCRWVNHIPFATWSHQLPTWVSFIERFLYLLVVLFIASVCALVWLVLRVLPVVLMGGTAAALAIKTCGLKAVFPCCVLLMNIFCIYCTGRIWGLWMKETYFSWISNKLRRMRGTALVKDSVAVEEAPLAAAEITSPPTTPKKTILGILFYRYWATLLKLSFLLCWCYAVIETIRPIEIFIPPSDSLRRSWDWWSLFVRAFYPNGTATGETYCITYQTGMMRVPQAMLSYWVDLDYPRWNTSHPALLSLYSSTYSPLTYEVLWRWIWILPWLSNLPTMFALVIYGLGHRSLDRACAYLRKNRAHEPSEFEAGHEEKPQETVDEGSIGATSPYTPCCAPDTAIPVKNPVDDSSEPDFCACPLYVGLIAIMAVMLRRTACFFCLPYPLVQLLVPEPLQLLALLLMVTVYGAWLGWKHLHEVIELRRETLAAASIPSTGAGEGWWSEPISLDI